ncbi:MAG: winged helix DNA-binding protein [Eggerthellaceae bacterium]|nr:winged helix DNA-binding protein [Eggerthellaceae bacterium]
MTSATKTLAQLKKASKLTNRAFHKNGPKSYKKGQGALLKVLHVSGGQSTSRDLVERLSFDRGELKNVVRKAERNGYVTIEDADEKRTYTVKLTAEGEKIAEKRCAANSKTADDILACLSEEEVAQLNALTEKIIVSCKDHGAHGKRKSGKKCRRHGRKH